MPEWDLPRSSASALLLVRIGKDHGVQPKVALRGTGFDEPTLAQTSTMVTPRQEVRIVRNLLGAVDRPEWLGLESGQHYHLTTYGVWGLALLSSPTPRAALEVGVAYVWLTFALCEHRVDRETGSTRLVIDGSELPRDVRRFYTDREVSSAVHTARQLVPWPVLAAVHLSGPPPPDASRYADVLGLEPEFGASECSILYDESALDRPLPQSDPLAAQAAAESCRELLQQRRSRTGVTGEVRDCIVNRLREMPDIEGVAGDLHVSSRTLRRRLTAEGTSFRELVDEVRELLAEELLITGAMSVEQIGEQLGFATTPSFSTAFKRWKGVSPRAYVQTLA